MGMDSAVLPLDDCPEKTLRTYPNFSFVVWVTASPRRQTKNSDEGLTNWASGIRTHNQHLKRVTINQRPETGDPLNAPDGQRAEMVFFCCSTIELWPTESLGKGSKWGHFQ